MSHSNFSNAFLEEIKIYNSVINEANFNQIEVKNCVITKCIFNKCNFSTSLFTKTKLKNNDFYRSSFQNSDLKTSTMHLDSNSVMEVNFGGTKVTNNNWIEDIYKTGQTEYGRSWHNKFYFRDVYQLELVETFDESPAAGIDTFYVIKKILNPPINEVYSE